ncbi:cyanophycinase [Luteimonas sp. e5]
MGKWRWKGIGMLLSACMLAACAATPKTAPQAGYDHYRIGDPAAPRPGAVRPGLLLIGGGEWPHDGLRWLFERAGHGHGVILRASLDDANQREMYQDIGGMASLQTFVFHSREAASDPRVLSAVARADVLFIGGGDQSRYLRFWQGTPLQDAINRHVAAGKPLGGTSAGLAVQGRYVYGALDGGSLTSREALADSRTAAATLVEDFLRLEPLYSAGVLTDSHFAERERQARLMTMLAQLAERHPERPLRGLGIDEQTALAIDGTGQGRVFTNTGGRAWLIRPGGFRLEQGGPLQADGWEVVGIGRDSRLDTRSWRVIAPEFKVRATIRDGELQFSPPVPAPRP